MLSVASVAKHMITWSMIAPFPRRIRWRRVKRHKKEKISEHLTVIPRSSTIKGKKFATTDSRIDVNCHHVNVHMSAEAAVEVNLITDANSVINNNSPLINVNNKCQYV